MATTTTIEGESKMDSSLSPKLPSHIQMLSLHSMHSQDFGNLFVDTLLGNNNNNINDPSTPNSETIRYFLDTTSDLIMSGNPKYWEWRQVKVWLKKIKLSQMIKIFEEHESDGIDGETLLNLNINTLFTIYHAGTYGNPPFTQDNDRRITKFFKFGHTTSSALCFLVVVSLCSPF